MVRAKRTISASDKGNMSKQVENNVDENVPESVETNTQESTKNTADTLALDKSQQRKLSKQTKKIKKALKDGSIKINENRKMLKEKIEESRGLIYIGHLPHGFYEEEMRNYFKQFGKVTNVKVCRSRKTGNSKGYGYVEFEHQEVAKIAAESMDNYIMFKKRIVAEYVPYEKRPKRLFQGKSSNLNHTSVKTRQGKQKYTKNKIRDEKTVEKKARQVYKKLQKKIKKWESLGIQCSLVPVGLSDKLQKQIKLEEKSGLNITSGENSQLEKGKYVKPLKSPPKSVPNKSVMKIKLKPGLLTKSLDTVKTKLKKNPVNLQSEETQTVRLRRPKKEQRSEDNRVKGGIIKGKKKKNALTLNSETVKKIARELIRKRGNPLINLTTKGTTKRK